MEDIGLESRQSAFKPGALLGSLRHMIMLYQTNQVKMDNLKKNSYLWGHCKCLVYSVLVLSAYPVLKINKYKKVNQLANIDRLSGWKKEKQKIWPSLCDRHACVLKSLIRSWGPFDLVFPHIRISEIAILVLGGHQYLIPILDTQLHCREYALLVFGKDI